MDAHGVTRRIMGADTVEQVHSLVAELLLAAASSAVWSGESVELVRSAARVREAELTREDA